MERVWTVSHKMCEMQNGLSPFQNGEDSMTSTGLKQQIQEEFDKNIGEVGKHYPFERGMSTEEEDLRKLRNVVLVLLDDAIKQFRKEVILFEIDLNSRIILLKDTELDNPKVLKNFWFRQQRDTLLELVERKNKLKEFLAFLVGNEKKEEK